MFVRVYAMTRRTSVFIVFLTKRIIIFHSYAAAATTTAIEYRLSYFRDPLPPPTPAQSNNIAIEKYSSDENRRDAF